MVSRIPDSLTCMKLISFDVQVCSIGPWAYLTWNLFKQFVGQQATAGSSGEKQAAEGSSGRQHQAAVGSGGEQQATAGGL